MLDRYWSAELLTVSQPLLEGTDWCAINSLFVRLILVCDSSGEEGVFQSIRPEWLWLQTSDCDCLWDIAVLRWPSDYMGYRSRRVVSCVVVLHSAAVGDLVVWTGQSATWWKRMISSKSTAPSFRSRSSRNPWMPRTTTSTSTFRRAPAAVASDSSARLVLPRSRSAVC